MIVLDANILVAFLTRDDAFHETATQFLSLRAEAQFAVNALTLAESLVHPVRHGRAEETLRALRPLGLQVVEITADDALSIAQVREATGLRLPDAIVVYSAEKLDAEIATTDIRLLNAARGRGIAAFDLSER